MNADKIETTINSATQLNPAADANLDEKADRAANAILDELWRCVNRILAASEARKPDCDADGLRYESLMQELAAFERDDPRSIPVLRKLATYYGSIGEPSELDAAARALEVGEKAYGPDHPSLLEDMHRLAGLHDSRDHYGEAEKLGRRALAIEERIYGMDHPEVAGTLSSIADACRFLGKYEIAERLLERAILVNGKHFGPHSREVAWNHCQFAEVYQRQKKYVLAGMAIRRALATATRGALPGVFGEADTISGKGQGQ